MPLSSNCAPPGSQSIVAAVVIGPGLELSVPDCRACCLQLGYPPDQVVSTQFVVAFRVAANEKEGNLEHHIICPALEDKLPFEPTSLLQFHKGLQDVRQHKMMVSAFEYTTGRGMQALVGKVPQGSPGSILVPKLFQTKVAVGISKRFVNVKNQWKKNIALELNVKHSVGVSVARSGGYVCNNG